MRGHIRESIPSALKEVESMQVADEKAFLRFLGLAARLAATGREYEAAFLRWPVLARELKLVEEFPGMLRRRVADGESALAESDGEELARAVTDAEDFACFANRCRKLTPDAGRAIVKEEGFALIDLWRCEAEETVLDDAAVLCLQEWAEEFPLSECRLAAVAHPFSDVDDIFLSAPELVGRVVDEEISLPAARERRMAAANASNALAAASGAPTQTLMDALELNLRLETRRFGPVNLVRRLSEQWRLAVWLTLDNRFNTVVPLSRVRFGGWPAKPTRDSGWSVDLRYLPQAVHKSIVTAPIRAELEDGTELCLC